MTQEIKILFYTTPQGNFNISIRFVNETFWLTQKAMATLFDYSMDNISLLLKNIFKSQELDPISVTDVLSATENK
ncbi:MAG: hypothetical protein QM535_16725 [Limnohabitans sp.]|nr:hypothetical protein [Limnohabitans sp.]